MNRSNSKVVWHVMGFGGALTVVVGIIGLAALSSDWVEERLNGSRYSASLGVDSAFGQVHS